MTDVTYSTTSPAAPQDRRPPGIKDDAPQRSPHIYTIMSKHTYDNSQQAAYGAVPGGAAYNEHTPLNQAGAGYDDPAAQAQSRGWGGGKSGAYDQQQQQHVGNAGHGGYGQQQQQYPPQTGQAGYDARSGSYQGQAQGQGYNQQGGVYVVDHQQSQSRYSNDSECRDGLPGCRGVTRGHCVWGMSMSRTGLKLTTAVIGDFFLYFLAIFVPPAPV